MMHCVSDCQKLRQLSRVKIIIMQMTTFRSLQNMGRIGMLKSNLSRKSNSHSDNSRKSFQIRVFYNLDGDLRKIWTGHYDVRVSWHIIRVTHTNQSESGWGRFQQLIMNLLNISWLLSSSLCYGVSSKV